MDQQEIITHIKNARAAGKNETTIRQELQAAGVSSQAISSAFTTLNFGIPTEIQKVVLEPAKPPIQTPSQVTPTVTPVPTPVIPHTPLEASQIPHTKLSWFKQPIGLIIAVVVLLAVGGVGLAYQQGVSIPLLSPNPEKIWNKFASQSAAKTYHTSFSASYFDPNKGPNKPGAFPLKDVSLKVNGTAYIHATDSVETTKSQSEISYTFGSGNTSFTTGLKYKITDNNFYLNIGDNPFLAGIMMMDAGTEEGENKAKKEWMKISLNPKDYEEFKDEATENFWKDFSDQKYTEELTAIWKDKPLLQLNKFLGKEKIRDITTLRYTVTLNKDNVKQGIKETVHKIVEDEKDVKQEDVDEALSYVNALIDKLEVKTFEIWLGQKDNHMYKIHFVSNAPSIVHLFQLLEEEGATGSEDAKRLADVRQMASALELYYNDNGGYPGGNGIPEGLTPTYIGQIPTAPKATGNCTDYYNKYWYIPEGTVQRTNDGNMVYSSYRLTFCLGGDTGGYEAGIGTLSPQGISTTTTCPDNTQNCFGPASSADQEAKIKSIINKLNFDATFTVEAEYFDYGKEINIEVPSNTYDLLEQIKKQAARSRDGQRVSDMYSLSSNISSYQYENSAVPASLHDLTNQGITIPTTPTPPDGTCSAEQNAYTYRRIDSNRYQLSFCLGTDYGSYKPGVHTMTESGIQ